MKTLKQVAQVLGASEPVIRVRSLANVLHILPPISLRQLITRGSYEMDQPIRDKWAELGWETGPLGWPTTETLSKDEDFVHYTEFQHGAIYWTGETGVHAILEPIWSSFNTFPYDHVVPITDTLKTADGRGLFSDCLRYGKDASNKYHVLPQLNVSWYWSQTTGLHWMEGLIASKWKELGGVQGSLGYPVSDTLPGSTVEWAYPDSGGAINFSGGHYQIFEHGTISKYTDWWTRYSSKETFAKVYATQSGDPFPPEFYTHLDGTHGWPPGGGDGPPPEKPPEISVSSSGSGQSSVFVVTGSGFSPNKQVKIRVVDDVLNERDYFQSADGAGKLNARFSSPCISGYSLHFSATDGRYGPGDVTGVLWSNTVTTSCP